MNAGEAAQIACARRKVKQAQDACRKAAQRLAAAEQADVYGHVTCMNATDVQTLVEIVRLALSEHPQVEVVVLTCST